MKAPRRACLSEKQLTARLAFSVRESEAFQGVDKTQCMNDKPQTENAIPVPYFC